MPDVGYRERPLSLVVGSLQEKLRGSAVLHSACNVPSATVCDSARHDETESAADGGAKAGARGARQAPECSGKPAHRVDERPRLDAGPEAADPRRPARQARRRAEFGVRVVIPTRAAQRITTLTPNC